MAAIRHEEEEEEQNKTFSFGKYTTEEDFFASPVCEGGLGVRKHRRVWQGTSFEEKVENRGKSHQAKNKGLAKIAPPSKALLLFHLRFISLFLLLFSFCSIREN